MNFFAIYEKLLNHFLEHLHYTDAKQCIEIDIKY